MWMSLVEDGVYLDKITSKFLAFPVLQVEILVSLKIMDVCICSPGVDKPITAK